MRATTWSKKKVELLDWVELQPASDNITAIRLALDLGDKAANDDLRSTYWTAICSIGSLLPYFPEGPPFPGARDGGLRKKFREKLYYVKTTIRERGRVIFNDGQPSLENLNVEATFCDNRIGLDKAEEVRQICNEFRLQEQNVHIHFRDCSPKPRRSRYERTGRSGAYHGGNTWEPGN